ncbi:MAG: signal recognition particle protein Srp19, partial [Candidatus Nanohaloarchaea archaeon]|nr:signal recognition particle protein Srp19 [Candidatus Nanohaloarchaea archaeon]
RKEHVLNVVYEELAEILGDKKPEIEAEPKKILLLGLHGVGKTTSAAKLADFYRKRGLKVGLIAADVHRPAAYEQLKKNAEKADAEFYGDPDSESAEKVVKKGMRELKGCEIVIVDSAGRDSMNQELENELQQIESAFNPDEKVLVVPADIGQSARDHAEKFQDAVGVDGVIVSKMDSTAKGGGALTSCYMTGAEVWFVGTGEKLEDLEIYDPEDFVSELLGVPDLSSLLEKAEEAFSEEDARKFMEGDFTLRDFYNQMEQVSSMGAMDKMLDMLPFGDKIPDNALDMAEGQVETYKHVIDSMTEEEMEEPKIVGSSRAERIAKGSGTSKGDVRQMIKQYRQAKNMMDKFSGRNMEGQMKQMMKQMGMG